MASLSSHSRQRAAHRVRSWSASVSESTAERKAPLSMTSAMSRCSVSRRADSESSVGAQAAARWWRTSRRTLRAHCFVFGVEVGGGDVGVLDQLASQRRVGDRRDQRGKTGRGADIAGVFAALVGGHQLH